MDRDKLLVVMAVLLILAAVSLQEKGRMPTGKAGMEISGTFNVIDEPPRLLQSIPNYTVKPSQNLTININLSTYFKEPNNQNMTYAYTAPARINVSLDNATGALNLTLQEGWKGRANVTITAYDSINNNLTSNDIIVIIREINITKSTFDSITGIGWYEGQNSGKIDINSLADGELENSTDIIVEKYDYGRILFAESINISSNTNLDADINISNNHIELNSSALPNFNVTAMLSLYNLTFTNPRVLKDGVLCPSTVCTGVNYSGGVFIFNVTGFSAYSAEESPVVEAPSAGAGRAGGAGAAPKRGGISAAEIASTAKGEGGFELDAYKIKTDVRQNRVKKEIVKVSNPTDKEIEIKTELTKELGFVHKEDAIKINAGETKDIEIIIAPTEEDAPNTYTTQLVLKKENIAKYVPMIIDVQALLQLLDIEMEIYSEDATVSPQENLLAGLQIFNLGESESVDVKIDWYVKDFNDNVLLAEHDAITVETQKVLMKKVYIPGTIEPGEYVLVAVATYDESSAVASGIFKIAQKALVEKPITPEAGIFYTLLAVIAVLIILIIILIIVIYHEKKEIMALITRDGKIIDRLSRKFRIK